jgi:folate-dependent phosphoribosylglycinamide formyltransferase PurN
VSPAEPPPIKVVVFSSGPVMTHDARRFICRLHGEPDIELLGVFCQAESTSAFAVAKDLWRRRGMLMVPLLLLFSGRAVGRFLRRPRAEISLRKVLTALSDRIHYVADIHADPVTRRVRELSPDLGLVYGSPVLRPALFAIPRLGTLGIHHGRVPQYRGNKTTFWAMYNGEDVAGVTIQKINAGLDTGHIVREATVAIGARSQASVVRELEAVGLDIYVRSILDIREGVAEFRPQSGPKGKLYRNPKLADLLRFHLVRAKRRLGRAPARTSQARTDATAAEAPANDRGSAPEAMRPPSP